MIPGLQDFSIVLSIAKSMRELLQEFFGKKERLPSYLNEKVFSDLQQEIKDLQDAEDRFLKAIEGWDAQTKELHDLLIETIKEVEESKDPHELKLLHIQTNLASLQSAQAHALFAQFQMIFVLTKKSLRQERLYLTGGSGHVPQAKS